MLSSSASFLRLAAIAIALAMPAVVFSCEGTTGDSPKGNAGGASSSGIASSSTGTTSTSSMSTSSGSTSSGSAGTGGHGGSGGSSGAPDAGDAGDSSAIDGDAANLCQTQQINFPILPAPHVATCSPVLYSSEPPTSGPHYPIWAAFKTYAKPVPRGFYVHDLEHGAMVILYNCPQGCDAELAQLKAFLDARPADPLCVAPVKNRFVVTPDPLSDVPFAAAAWGAALRSQCFDLPALGAFIDAHYGLGPEALCGDGVDVTDPAAGIPADCGEAIDAGDAGPG